MNEASIRDLRERVMSKYSDPKIKERIKIEVMPFRPNLIIDTGVPYSEDSFQEVRVANTMIRIVGYCSRCKATACNFDTNDRNYDMEPTETLNTYRKHKELGTLLGTYH